MRAPNHSGLGLRSDINQLHRGAAAAEQLGLAREGVARVRVTRLDTTAVAFPNPSEQWSGRVRVPHRYYNNSRDHRYRRRVYSGRIIRDPVGTWLLELMR